jgi:hypothetical protein
MKTVRGSGMEMAPMMPATEMMAVTAATMTAPAATAVPAAMTTFRNREVRHAQRCREDNGCDS